MKICNYFLQIFYQKAVFCRNIWHFAGLCTECFPQFLLKFCNVLLIRFHIVGRIKSQTATLIQEPFRFCAALAADAPRRARRSRIIHVKPPVVHVFAVLPERRRVI